MSGPPLGPGLWLAAALPLLLVAGAMLGLRWDSGRAGPLGWASALLVALLAFGATPRLLLVSQLRGLMLSLWVLLIVWAALLLYAVVDEAGALAAVSAALRRLTPDRGLQLLALGWVFSSFLQGVTGFGVPVAVVAPLLVGLGFPALTAVVVPSLAHTWAVSFGSVGTSIAAMSAVTALPPEAFAPASALATGLACLACGVGAVLLGLGPRALPRLAPALALLWAVMFLAQLAMARTAAWPLASFGASALALAALPLLARLPRYAHPPEGAKESRDGPAGHGSDSALEPSVERRRADDAAPSTDGEASMAAVEPGAEPAASREPMSLAMALAGYAALAGLVVLARSLPQLRAFLGAATLAVPTPETATSLGWVNPAGLTKEISLLGHTGLLIAYAALLTALLYAVAGRYRPGALGRVLSRTLRGSRKPTIGILWLVGMALILGDSGMTDLLARGLAAGAGPAFPLVAPAIGALGAFVTGSNANSNVLFAPLQQGTARALGLDPALILAAQNVGAAVGSGFAPAKVVIGVSTVGLVGGESRVLRRVMAAGLVIVALAGVGLGLALWWGGRGGM